MKLKTITEAQYAGTRNLRALLRFFVRHNNPLFDLTVEEWRNEGYGEIFKINDKFIAKWDENRYSGEITYITIPDDPAHGCAVFDEGEGSLAENVDPKTLVEKIQIFAKPKRLF